MRVLTWNVARGGNPEAWRTLEAMNWDIALLQEAHPNRIPAGALFPGLARRRDGGQQPWGSSIATRPQRALMNDELREESRPWLTDWINRTGHAIVAAELPTDAGNVLFLSCYSPAWPVSPPSIGVPSEEEKTGVRLRAQKRDIWLADLLWAYLDGAVRAGREVIAAGDFNLSVSFDRRTKVGSGNREYIERMQASGLTEVVRHFHPNEDSTPTFRDPRSKTIEHQLDYIWVSPGIKPRLRACELGPTRLLIENISDHLPISVDIDLKTL